MCVPCTRTCTCCGVSFLLFYYLVLLENIYLVIMCGTVLHYHRSSLNYYAATLVEKLAVVPVPNLI